MQVEDRDRIRGERDARGRTCPFELRNRGNNRGEARGAARIHEPTLTDDAPTRRGVDLRGDGLGGIEIEEHDDHVLAAGVP